MITSPNFTNNFFPFLFSFDPATETLFVEHPKKEKYYLLLGYITAMSSLAIQNVPVKSFWSANTALKLSLVGFTIVTVSFSIALSSVYNQLNHRISKIDSKETKDHIEHIQIDHNITLEINNLTDVSDELLTIKMQLADQYLEIDRLHNVIEYQLNTTVKKLNETVQKVQNSVMEQVEQVNENVNSQSSLMAYQFAGTFAILGILISFWHMMTHVRKMHEPAVQRKIIAILWMIPIYSVSSWFSLVYPAAQDYFSIFKDIYEAYLISTFLSFLMAILGKGDRNAVITLLAKHADHLKPPMRFCVCAKQDVFPTPRHKADAVLTQCQFFTMQFVFVRPITTIAMVIADQFYECRWDPKCVQFYIMMAVNISIFFAFTGLIRFYHVVNREIKWVNPFAKFLCIKGVVFMTFWQSIVISFIAHAVYRRQADVNEEYDATEWSKQAQSFLVCLEMFFFAIVHIFVFPTEEWESNYKEKHTRMGQANVGDLALKDFFKDVKLVMSTRKKLRRERRLREKKSNKDDLALMDDIEENDRDIDIDWSQGWGRIEKYIETLDPEDDLPLENKSEDLQNKDEGDHDAHNDESGEFV